MNPDELKVRTRQFALRVMRMVEALPCNRSSNAIAHQLVCSGPAVGANDRATCRARSKAEFVAKFGILEEEADESACWMELIIDAELLPAAKESALLQASSELTAIMAASRISAPKRRWLNWQSSIAHRQSRILPCSSKTSPRMVASACGS